jgi:tRNA A37 N6-isopentenylltransferase MiaA
MEIWVETCGTRELIGNSREELAENLAHTATRKYAASVLTWFDDDHSQPLIIEEQEGDDHWTVIEDQ